MIKFTVRAFEIDMTVAFSPEYKSDTYAESSDDGFDIIIYSSTHPRIIERTIIHELAHGVTANLYLHVFNILAPCIAKDPELFKDFIDEHSSIMTEIGILIEKNHRDELDNMIEAYKTMYNELSHETLF